MKNEIRKQFKHYTDLHAMAELKKEMVRYSRDIDSAVRSAFDFAIWLFRRLDMNTQAEIVEREKLEVLSDTNSSKFKEADTKTIAQYIHVQLIRANYNLTALVFENEIVDKLGELDEIKFKTWKDKQEAQKEEGLRVLEDMDKAKVAESVTVTVK